jgi:hypothetical protein
LQYDAGRFGNFGIASRRAVACCTASTRPKAQCRLPIWYAGDAVPRVPCIMYKVWTWSQQVTGVPGGADRNVTEVWAGSRMPRSRQRTVVVSCIVRSGRTSVLHWTKQNQNQLKAEVSGGLGASRTAGSRKRGSRRGTVGGVEEKTNSRR